MPINTIEIIKAGLLLVYTIARGRKNIVRQTAKNISSQRTTLIPQSFPPPCLAHSQRPIHIIKITKVIQNNQHDTCFKVFHSFSYYSSTSPKLPQSPILAPCMSYISHNLWLALRTASSSLIPSLLFSYAAPLSAIIIIIYFYWYILWWQL